MDQARDSRMRSTRRRDCEPPLPEPLAYFLTWPTYGTWLPGDERGWVEYRHSWQLPDPARKQLSRICGARSMSGSTRSSLTARMTKDPRLSSSSRRPCWDIFRSLGCLLIQLFL